MCLEMISIHFIVITYWLKLIIIIIIITHFQESYLDLDNAYELVIKSYYISSLPFKIFVKLAKECFELIAWLKLNKQQGLAIIIKSHR